jgi:hypothetical protein
VGSVRGEPRRYHGEPIRARSWKRRTRTRGPYSTGETPLLGAPDIIIVDQDTIAIIEVKTVGHSLSQYQKACYEALKELLRKHGYSAEIYYLLSAGHEEDTDWQILRRQSESSEPSKILLWEKVLQYFDGITPAMPIMKCLGDVQPYYRNESEYMSW